MFVHASAGWNGPGSASAVPVPVDHPLLTPALDPEMIRFRAEPPVEKPAAQAATKATKTAPKAKTSKSAPEEDLLDLASENEDEKD